MANRSTLERRIVRALAPWMMLSLMLVASACGADIEEPGPGPGPGTDDGPRVADPRFEGRFEITELRLDGAAQPLVSSPSIEFETEFGGLLVEPGCNTYFGSFTLEPDGTASITVAGGSDQACPEFADQEQAVLEALRATMSWIDTESGFRLDGDGGRSISLDR